MWSGKHGMVKIWAFRKLSSQPRKQLYSLYPAGAALAIGTDVNSKGCNKTTELLEHNKLKNVSKQYKGQMKLAALCFGVQIEYNTNHQETFLPNHLNGFPVKENHKVSHWTDTFYSAQLGQVTIEVQHHKSGTLLPTISAVIYLRSTQSLCYSIWQTDFKMFSANVQEISMKPPPFTGRREMGRGKWKSPRTLGAEGSWHKYREILWGYNKGIQPQAFAEVLICPQFPIKDTG